MKYPIVVANEFMQCAIYALINSNPRSQYPHATVYLKRLYGSATPKVCALNRYGWQQLSNAGEGRRSAFMRLLESVLTSEGRNVPYPFSEHMASLMFPYVVHRERQREKHRLNAQVNIRMKIGRRQREEALQKRMDTFLSLPVCEMVDWLYDNPDISKRSLRYFLQSYWLKHNKSEHAFSDLYLDDIDDQQLIIMVKNDIQV
ncbi:plasmid SOS inhibition protein A [Vibrio vulnificus]|uniref:plasmid SOS inhibition protein A n=1 Tax=Vibrio vulnificus TaxID=672 RepID=UPI0010230471|nr:plasmid SOS inhibition protein A [Vibrio vulnificus]RZQ33198.1 hypothetical protein D8T38_18315 [Vibrio vulnificus]